MERQGRIGLEHEELTGAILAGAVAVHRELEPGFLESIYEEALAVELTRRDLRFERQIRVPVSYGGVTVGLHRLDLLVEDEVVVELKAVRGLESVHFATVHSYLKAASKRVGLLLNFNAATLQIKRILNPRSSVIPCFRDSSSASQ